MAIAAEQLVREHAGGASYRALGEHYGLGKTTVATMIESAIDELVFTATIDLYTAWRDEQATGVGEYPVFVVPHQGQADRQVALRMVDLVRGRLTARGVPVKTIVKNVPVDDASPGGQVFMLTLDQNELDRRDAAKEA